jgi:hypothetical protein
MEIPRLAAFVNTDDEEILPILPGSESQASGSGMT